jgi:hypothetical protein
VLAAFEVRVFLTLIGSGDAKLRILFFGVSWAIGSSRLRALTWTSGDLKSSSSWSSSRWSPSVSSGLQWLLSVDSRYCSLDFFCWLLKSSRICLVWELGYSSVLAGVLCSGLSEVWSSNKMFCC